MEENKKNIDVLETEDSDGIRFCLDEVAKLLLELIAGGTHYGSFSIVRPDDGDDLTPALFVTGDDCGGACGCGEDYINAVPVNEVLWYAETGQAPSPCREYYTVSEEGGKTVLEHHAAKMTVEEAAEKDNEIAANPEPIYYEPSKAPSIWETL